MSHIMFCALKRLLSLLLLVAVSLPLMAAPQQSAQRPAPETVLFISSFTPQLPAQVSLQHGLQQNLPEQIRVSYEYLGMPAYGSKHFYDDFARYLQGKYQNNPPATIIDWDAEANIFLKQHADLFTASRRLHLEPGQSFAPRPGDRVIHATDDHQPTLASAITMTGARQIVVVGSTEGAGGIQRSHQIQVAIDALGLSDQTRYLFDWPQARLKTELASLPKDTLVYYGLMFSDGEGRLMTPRAIAQELSQAASAPVFSYWESLLGSGIVGGLQLSMEVMGQ